MYTLVSGLLQQLARRDEYFIVILGLDNAGKTTLLERIKAIFNGVQGLRPDQIGPTVGLNVGKVNVKNVQFNFWDLGGQRDLQSIWEKYYSECHAVVFVVDSTDRARIEEVRDILERVIKNDEIEGVPVLMLANKQDVPDALKLHEIQKIFNQIAVALEARDSRAMQVSALKGEGVREAVEWLYVRVVRNRENRPPIVRN